MKELYVITNWTGTPRQSLVEGTSKMNAFLDWLQENQSLNFVEGVEVDYRGATVNRAYVEAEVEFFNLSHKAPKDCALSEALSDFIIKLMDRWQRADKDLQWLEHERDQALREQGRLFQYTNQLNHRNAELEHELSSLDITITVRRGCVEEVKGLPSSAKYEIIDLDIHEDKEPA